MSTATIHEGVRRMRFSSLLDRQERGEITQEEAAGMLGVHVRTFQRWSERFTAEGEDGLQDRRCGKVSPKRAPAEDIERMLGLYGDKYSDFTVKHFHEKLLARHNYVLCYTVTKLHLQASGLVVPAPNRSAHRKKRARRPLPGMMLHQDGSRHVWIEGLAPLDLIVTLDDGRRKERQPQNPTDVGRVDLLGLGDLVDRPVGSGLQQLAPAKPARDCLDHGVVDPCARGNPARCPVRGDDLLTTAALADGEGYFDGDRPGLFHQAARRLAAAIPARS